MQWFEKCIMELTHHNVFGTTEHRLRFRDLISCYCDAPFFNKALCKSMFLASTDDAHFIEMLSDLNALVLDDETSLRLLADRCVLSAQHPYQASDELYHLAVSFMNNTPYEQPNYSLLDSDTAFIIRQALLAAQLIDELPAI